MGYSDTYRETNCSSGLSIGAAAASHDINNIEVDDDENPVLYEKAIDMIRLKAESADFFQGTILFHSLAGGTGSGLGSRLIESYRDYFGRSSHLMTVSIWPSMAGETPLQ